MTTSTSSQESTTLEPTLLSVRVAPEQVLVGDGAILLGTVTLSAQAPAGGVEVDIITDQPEVVSVPALVRVAEGSLSNTFEVSVLQPDQRVAVEITASYRTSKEFARFMLGRAESDPMPSATV